jgi:predicted RNase H-like nuclease (RuvC/YqgF family)
MKTEEPFKSENKSQEGIGQKSDAPIISSGNASKTALVICIIIIIGISAVFFMVQQHNNNQISLLNNDKHVMAELIHIRDSTLNNYVGTFNEIDSNLELIRKKENIIHYESNNREFTLRLKSRVLEDIQFLNYLLDKNKKLIADLTLRLNNSGTILTQFQSKLGALNKMITERDTSIAQLKQELAKKDFEIAQLNMKASNMDDQIKKQTMQISNMGSQLSSLDTEINRAYLISGTYNELKKKGVVTKKGGIFGIGGNTQMSSSVAENSFEPIDIRHTKSINISAKNAEFITNHPKDSYQWVKKEDKIQSLVIIDPNKFWKYTKFAVLETQ